MIELHILEGLYISKQRAFACLACQRLYPNYLFFSREQGFGRPEILERAIGFLEASLWEEQPDEAEAHRHLSLLESVIPTPGDFDTVLASSALDACAVIYESLHFLLDGNPDRLRNISVQAIDTVDMYVQEREDLDFYHDPFFQQKIDGHPLMLRELSIQRGVLSFLSQLTTFHPDDFHTLMLLQERQGRGSLDL